MDDTRAVGAVVVELGEIAAALVQHVIRLQEVVQVQSTLLASLVEAIDAIEERLLAAETRISDQEPRNEYGDSEIQAWALARAVHIASHNGCRLSQPGGTESSTCPAFRWQSWRWLDHLEQFLEIERQVAQLQSPTPGNNGATFQGVEL